MHLFEERNIASFSVLMIITREMFRINLQCWNLMQVRITFVQYHLSGNIKNGSNLRFYALKLLFAQINSFNLTVMTQQFVSR